MLTIPLFFGLINKFYASAIAICTFLSKLIPNCAAQCKLAHFILVTIWRNCHAYTVTACSDNWSNSL